MIVRKLRIKRSWSQEQLAEMSGLSVRTIQRIERGQSSSTESLKSIAAVFEIDVTSLIKDNSMDTKENIITAKEESAIQHVKELKGFYTHLIQFLVIVSVLAFINFLTMPGYYWVIWVIVGWGAGIISHAINVFEVFSFFGADWEKRQVEKRLGKKL